MQSGRRRRAPSPAGMPLSERDREPRSFTPSSSLSFTARRTPKNKSQHGALPRSCCFAIHDPRVSCTRLITPALGQRGRGRGSRTAPLTHRVTRGLHQSHFRRCSTASSTLGSPSQSWRTPAPRRGPSEPGCVRRTAVLCRPRHPGAGGGGSACSRARASGKTQSRAKPRACSSSPRSTRRRRARFVAFTRPPVEARAAAAPMRGRTKDRGLVFTAPKSRWRPIHTFNTGRSPPSRKSDAIAENPAVGLLSA